MFAVVVLNYIEKIFTSVLDDADIAGRAKSLREEINAGIENHGMVKDANGNDIYAYEVDGLGNATLMDDSNVPNLISAPYLGYVSEDDERYIATRKALLSDQNPYYFEGKYAKGIGSSHTPDGYVWPIAIAMEGLTTTDRDEKLRILNLLTSIDAGTGFMHEGVDVNNPNNYTREWFSWANMMFCELVMDYYGVRVQK
jgi:meiotically up-regulated gene 157 (Mug157) protein